jgi:hypothetical protein
MNGIERFLDTYSKYLKHKEYNIQSELNENYIFKQYDKYHDLITNNKLDEARQYMISVLEEEKIFDIKLKEIKTLVTYIEANDYTEKIFLVDVDESIGDGGVGLYQKQIELDDTLTVDTDWKSELFDFINKIADKRITKPEFIITDKNKASIVITNACYYILCDGKIGLPTNMFISEENYNNLDVKKILEEKEPQTNMIITFIETDDIVIYRNNETTQPGVRMYNYYDKYKITSTGYCPEKQIIKIKIKL